MTVEELCALYPQGFTCAFLMEQAALRGVKLPDGIQAYLTEAGYTKRAQSWVHHSVPARRHNDPTLWSTRPEYVERERKY